MHSLFFLSSIFVIVACQKNEIKIGDGVRFKDSSSCFTKVVELKDDQMAVVSMKNETKTISLREYVVCTLENSVDSTKTNVSSGSAPKGF